MATPGTKILNLYDLADGDTEVIIERVPGAMALSFQTLNDINLDAADATVKIAQSNDGLNPLDLTGVTVTLPAGTVDQNIMNVNVLNSKFYHVIVTVNSVTAGALTVILNY